MSHILRILPTVIYQLSGNARKPGFPTRSNTNRHVESEKKARSLTFRFSEEERLFMYCLFSENRGDGQLRTADLFHVFHIDKNPVFS